MRCHPRLTDRGTIRFGLPSSLYSPKPFPFRVLLECHPTRTCWQGSSLVLSDPFDANYAIFLNHDAALTLRVDPGLRLLRRRIRVGETRDRGPPIDQTTRTVHPSGNVFKRLEWESSPSIIRIGRP